jgi:serine/threonine protein kinase
MPATNEILQGRYRIVAQMGQNGTGPVYQAYDENLQADVVLREIFVKLNKVTTPAQMESIRSAFTGEAKILAGITHEAFVRVRDHFSDVDRHYLVLEAVDGEYLSEMLEKGSTFSVPDVVRWADHLLDGLNHLHTKVPQLIHGDIKPQNIKLTSAGEIKLLALGVARDLNKGSSITDQPFDATALHYLPLEQIWGNLDLASQKVIASSYDEASEEQLMQPHDARADIFALGATLYHLLTGQRPLDSLERSIDILEGKADPLQTPTKLNPDVPPEISYVLMKAMEIKREKRFESVLMMRQVLKTAALRAKEREAQDAKKQTVIAAPEIRLPEPKQLKADQPAAAQKEIESETDPARQLELIKARLLEAENRRQLAEQRAADAERRLHEKEISISKAPEDALLDIPESAPKAAVLSAVEDDLAQVLEMPKRSSVAARPARPAKAAEQVPNDFEFSFTEESKNKAFQWKALAAAAVLTVAAGGGFGIWTFMSSNSAPPAQSISTPVMSLNDTAKPEPTAENVTSPATETAAQPSAENAVTENSTPAATTASGTTPGKGKAPVQIAKQPAAAKTPAKQKKAVTVDDLINDN